MRDGLGIQPERVERLPSAIGIERRVQIFRRRRRIGHCKRPDPARRALQGMMDIVPALGVASLQNALELGDQIVGLRFEKLQNFCVKFRISARVAGEMGQIDRLRLGAQGNWNSGHTRSGMLMEMDQNGVNEIAAAVEPAAIAAWPARHTLEIGGWLMRFTDGYSHRGNSVSATGFHGHDVYAQIAVAEIAYFSRGLQPLFQITPLTQPGNLEKILIDRGYICEAPTNVMIAKTTLLRDLPSSDAVLSDEPNAAFKSLVISGSHSYADGCERLDTLARVTAPHIHASISDGDIGIACGMCVAMKDWAGINLMRTQTSYRRNGYAMRILSSLARWAEDAGAKNLYLQVEQDNAPARALYAKAGFKGAYSYRFYRAP